MAYDTILTDKRDHVLVITLNRTQQLNALNAQMMAELAAALAEADQDPRIGVSVVTGSERAFAAGADIKEMAELSYPESYVADYAASYEAIARARKPIIAAVAGYALGGGCELAMMCDIIIAADTAKFGQPEITLGIIPGIGGTQRLTHAVGKAKAMDLILTGRHMEAAEAESCGLVARVVPVDDLMDTALEAADKIGELSHAAVMMAKEAVNQAAEMPLSAGLVFERRLFQSLFATEDQAEGMEAFVEKRSAQFRNR
ncbi:MAG: enoyl-CoA hydratase [Devosiaceae bacterium]|nr:enoyl-CoA hydratase [Devosiaceae bacterium MH13]